MLKSKLVLGKTEKRCRGRGPFQSQGPHSHMKDMDKKTSVGMTPSFLLV